MATDGTTAERDCSTGGSAPAASDVPEASVAEEYTEKGVRGLRGEDPLPHRRLFQKTRDTRKEPHMRNCDSMLHSGAGICLMSEYVPDSLPRSRGRPRDYLRFTCERSTR